MESVRPGEPRWRAPLPSRSRSNSRLRGRVRPARSQGHLCTYLGSSSGVEAQDSGLQLPIRPSGRRAVSPP
ncbi:hypothetical protein NDU88_010603 [Pleurodeles waltl]|uniref:Uncharacterized protein n=1 Tax=Pleurodeles waltl TaxID=8319 RepID=A0AAV7R0P4_PLEWA|nr:hypothetical protein NDU88_010603 [Pleurodeles waltl]